MCCHFWSSLLLLILLALANMLSSILKALTLFYSSLKSELQLDILQEAIPDLLSPMIIRAVF